MVLMKCITPSRAGADELVHGSGSVRLLDLRWWRQRLLGGSTGAWLSLKSLVPVSTPLALQNNHAACHEGVLFPPPDSLLQCMNCCALKLPLLPASASWSLESSGSWRKRRHVRAVAWMGKWHWPGARAAAHSGSPMGEERLRLAQGECKCGSACQRWGCTARAPRSVCPCLSWAHAAFASHGPQPLNTLRQARCQETPPTRV